MGNKSNRILVIGDIHEPCARKGYLEFCKKVHKKYKCNQVVFIGDVVDSHAVSFHTRHPEMPSPVTEYELAYKQVQKWYKAFGKAKVCCGNHDARVIRVAESVSIPAKFLRNYQEIWNTRNWDWGWEHVIDRVCYQHGIAAGGMHPAYNTMKKLAMSVVIDGHPYLELMPMSKGEDFHDSMFD